MDFAFGQVGEIRWKFLNVNKKDSNYDTVILGDSHTRCSIDPNIIDEEAGLCAYDFLSTTTIADCRINYFEKIKEYCDENEINLICITSPITPTSYECLCYEQVNETMENFFENENVTYYDFNLLKEDVLDRTKDDYVDNEGHMGITLSKKYSTFLGEFLDTVISRDDVDTSIFYENIDEASKDLNNGE